MDARCTKNKITILWFLDPGSWILDLRTTVVLTAESSRSGWSLRLRDFALRRVYFELKDVNFCDFTSGICKSARERTTTSGLHCTLKHGNKWFVATVETGDKR